MNPMISIIIPVYNVETYLSKCIESILNQSYRNLEIILVDDGSTDRSGEICDEYKKKDDRIIILHKENGGVSRARNSGLDISSGEFIAFVDADDYIDVDYCKVLMDLVQRNDAEIACCSLVGDNGEISFPIDKQSCATGEVKSVELRSNEFGFFQWYSINAPFCKLIRKSLVKRAGDVRFDPELCVGEDLVFYIKLLKEATKCVAIAKPMYHYMIRDDSAMQTKDMRHLFSEVVAWNMTCNLLDKKWHAWKRASSKLLFYTYYFVEKAVRINQFDAEKRAVTKKIFRENREQKDILGKGLKFSFLYYLLMYNPQIYFKILK